MTKLTNNVMLLSEEVAEKEKEPYLPIFFTTVLARSRTWKSIGAVILKEMTVREFAIGEKRVIDESQTLERVQRALSRWRRAVIAKDA